VEEVGRNGIDGKEDVNDIRYERRWTMVSLGCRTEDESFCH